MLKNSIINWLVKTLEIKNIYTISDKSRWNNTKSKLKTKK